MKRGSRADERIISLREIARKFRVSRQTIRRWKIPYLRGIRGGRVFYRLSEVLKFMACDHSEGAKS